MFNEIIRFFQDGGVFMYPIGLVMVIAVTIALERYIVLSKTIRLNRKTYDDLLLFAKKKDFNKVYAYVKKVDCTISQVTLSLLESLKSDASKEDKNSETEVILLESVINIQKRSDYLNAFANIATLLGLLGTIMGLISAFSAVALADPAEKATLLSHSISLAMNTTAYGLIVAIPLLLANAMIQTKITDFVSSIELASATLTNLIKK